MAASSGRLSARLFLSAKGFAQRHPVFANSVTYGSILSVAEVMQQTIAGWEHYDWARVGRMAVIGGCAYGPLGFYWYRWLDKALPGTAKLTVMKKVIVDQCVSAPVFIAIFFTGSSIMEGKKDIFAELKDKFPQTYAASCCFWPIAQTFNFFFLPSHMRVVYVASASLVWSNFLCFMKRISVHKEEEPQSVEAAAQG
ncbi:mpv17-like protein [Acanthaster planci]|uniref:Mpv17-like protein n=1 Tax=Acanthaster planci TaxID=133434 RepID=A0A8B7ZGR4_ACAPL|nr:mpv17-like protein [Acanthaster planci]XP_022102430.1 mpv17-like protein [Acanthaster planci]XP_022102431.1 mpv17-like protein [Acanthaster planci]XP_022102433.1 mpv17-like protein [Acanthaster planci]